VTWFLLGFGGGLAVASAVLALIFKRVK